MTEGARTMYYPTAFEIVDHRIDSIVYVVHDLDEELLDELFPGSRRDVSDVEPTDEELQEIEAELDQR